VAVGNSLGSGGATEVTFHSDGVLNRPTSRAGDVPLIGDGRLAVWAELGHGSRARPR